MAPLTLISPEERLVHICATDSVEECAMALKFLGIWPNTPDDGSPTI